MPTLDEEDRREYYRIEDTIALEIKPLSAPKPQAQESDLASTMLPRSSTCSANCTSAEFESQHLLRQISERDRTIAAS